MSKKKKIAAIGFILCCAALLYPVISSRWNAYRSSRQIEVYNKQIQTRDYSDEWEKVREYNNSLGRAGQAVITQAEYQTDEEYESILNITHDGMMGYIEIPCIDVMEPVYHYTTDEVLEKGIGHIHGSSLPVGGEMTHAVFTGHRGLPAEKYFSDLGQVKEGDRFYLHILDQVLAYRVYDIQTVLPEEVSSLRLESGRDLVTLVTCTPYGVNTHRLLVTGERIPFDGKVEDGKVVSEKHKSPIDPEVMIFFGFLIFILAYTLVKKFLRKRNVSQ